MFRRPSRTLLPGIGVASAVLAGVLVAFTLAASLIGFDRASGESQRGAPEVVVVKDARRPPPAPPRRARAPRPPRSSAATPVRARQPAAARLTADPAVADAVRLPQPPPPPPPLPPPPPPPAQAAATAVAPAAPAPPPVPLEPVGAVVAGATDQLADDTRTLTQGLGKGVSGINPALGGIVGKAGEVLADVLEGTGKGLGVALGHRR